MVPARPRRSGDTGFDLAGSGMVYRAGDALGVWPTNCPELVIELLDLLDLTGSEAVTLKGKGEMRLAEALRRHLELTRITRDFLEFVRGVLDTSTVFAAARGRSQGRPATLDVAPPDRGRAARYAHPRRRPGLGVSPEAPPAAPVPQSRRVPMERADEVQLTN